LERNKRNKSKNERDWGEKKKKSFLFVVSNMKDPEGTQSLNFFGF
jgi:hypothetical protein